MTQSIIKAIDEKYKQSETCTISMKDITNFKWNKLVVFKVGSSKSEISNALGTKFENSTDLTGGMVFAYANKIVYYEHMSYNQSILLG